MRLEDYLKTIKECPDELVDFHDDPKKARSIPMLTSEYGIFNHFSIHMSADYDGIIKRFKNSPRYIMIFDIDGSVDTVFYICTRRDIVNVKMIPYFNEISQDFGNYAMTLDLFLDNYGRTDSGDELLNHARAIANVVDEIGKFVINENIPICLPHSVGWNYKDRPDRASRIVIHQPASEIYSAYLRI